VRERQIEARERNAKEMEAPLGCDGKKSPDLGGVF